MGCSCWCRWATTSRWSRGAPATRSTSARSRSALGGGGHSRAAAALIRETPLWACLETLVYLLQSHIRPTVTVGQIMSYGVPQTLAPADTIAEAAERMRRYGFEGFPVVEDGRIVGMLTRREIDRALHHGLGQHPVSRYMRTGEVYVTPDDSVSDAAQGDDRAGLGTGARARPGLPARCSASSPAPI